MMLKLTLCAAAFLLAAIPARAQAAGGHERKAFHLSSIGSGFGVQAEVEGDYQINEFSVEVRVTRARLYVSEHCPYQGRRSINSLRFGLWDDPAPAGRTKVKNKSEALPLSLVMSPREEHTLYELYFSLPRESAEDLSGRRLQIEIQIDALDYPAAKAGRGYVFALDCEDLSGHPAKKLCPKAPPAGNGSV